MRNVLFAAATIAVMTMPGGTAEAAAFCAYQGGPRGYENCGYYTWDQCRAAVSGVGGFCMLNPHDPAVWGWEAPVPPRHKHRRRAG